MVLEVTKDKKVGKDSVFQMLLQCLYVHLFVDGSDDQSTLVWLDSIVDLCFLHTALRGNQTSEAPASIASTIDLI